MPEGTVVTWNERTESGSVRPDYGATDIFLHRDHLRAKRDKGLAVGQGIRFVIGRLYSDPKANDVEVL